MGGLKDLFAGGIKDAVSGLGDAVKNAVSAFKADPTKIAELDADLKKAVQAHEEKMTELANNAEAKYLEDTQNARETNVKIQESDKASWLAKNVGYIIDLFVISLWGTMTIYLLVVMLKIVQKEQGVDYTAVTAIWGGISGTAAIIINFHRGTSRGSQDKQARMDAMVDKIMDK